MSTGVELVLVGTEGAEQSVVVGVGPFSVGRAPDNDLVLPDDRASWHHARFWIAGGRLVVHDLASRNGTYVNDQRIVSSKELTDGDSVRLGPGTNLRVRGEPRVVGLKLTRVLALEDLANGVRHPISGDRVHLGDHPESVVRFGDGVSATLLIHGDGDVWLGQDDEDAPIELGQPFTVGGHRFQLVEIEQKHAPTAGAEPDSDSVAYPYKLHASLDGPTGPQADVEHLETGLRCRIEAENRAVLLFVLARQLQNDREGGASTDDAGWCDDNDVILGVWGRSALGEGGNRLKVLVHRVRKELRAAGFDPWCIEKRRRCIRVRFAEVKAG